LLGVLKSVTPQPRRRRKELAITALIAPQLIDPRPIYHGATAWVVTLLRSVRADQGALPTPCEEFDVRTLSSHLVGTVGRVIAIAERGSADSVPPLAPEHDAETFARLAEQAQRAWADDALLDKPVAVPWGQVPGREALWGYVGEALVHGWDLAVATGQPCEADSALVEPAAAVVRHFIPVDIRVPGVPFSPVVEPRADAGPTERLANRSGRSSQDWI
jgi:uncharacterized protein (TIGR03086 family)